jgi:adenosylcobinamide kinase/adenosylcobinamide-phosphate guanylyltransferase
MQQVNGNSVTLVLGGVRSGKSRYAQLLAERSQRVAFIATAERRDDEEMRQKIARHRSERPKHWTTIEEPLQLATSIGMAAIRSDTVLVDCLTLYASNLMEAFDTAQLIHEQLDALCAELHSVPCPVILVSNEVGSGVVPAYALGRQFRDLVGEINQRVAAVADTVLMMVAGLPLALKGSIPAGVLR